MLISKNQLIIGGLCICFLWFVAIILTVFDHFRFRDWTHDPGPQSLTSVAKESLNSLTRNDPEKAAKYLDAGVREKSRDSLSDWHLKFCDAVTAVKTADLGTVDEVMFRAVLPRLRDLSLNPDEVLVLTPMVDSLSIAVGAPMKIALLRMQPESW